MCVTASGEFSHKTLQKFEPNSTVKLDLQLEKMVPVRGTIIDEEGKPVSEVQLEVAGFTKEISNRGTERIGMRDREMSPTVTTDEKGQFVFPKLPVGYVVRIDAGHPKYAYHSLSIRTTEDHPSFVYGNTRTEKIPVNDSGDAITMERGVEIGSKLVDGSGNPLADIEIQLMIDVVKTSKDGSFQARIRQGYLDKRKEIHLRIRSDVFGSLTKRISMETLVSKTSTIKLEKPAVLSGAVVDSNGQSVEGFTISIGSANMSYSRPSDKDGKFVVPKMPPGDVTVSLSGQVPGYHLDDVDIRRFTLKPGENKTLEPFVVQRVPSLRLIVEDEKGEPVVGARAQVLSPDEHSRMKPNSDWGTTAMDGSAEMLTFTKPEQGSLIRAEFSVGKKKFFGETLFDIKATESKVTLTPATTVSGTVTANGDPVANVTIEVKSSGPMRLVERNGFRVGQSVHWKVGTATTNEKGEYSIDVLDKNKAGQAGSYTVWARSGIPNPNAKNTGQRPVYADGKYSHDIKFFHGKGVVSGTVVDTDGKPVELVSVFVRRSLPLPNDNIEPSRYYYPSEVTTDENGKFRIEGLPGDGKLKVGTAPSHLLSSRDLVRKDYTIDKEVQVGDEEVQIQIPLKR